MTDNYHENSPDKHLPDGKLLDAHQYGINSGPDRWFGADGPDTGYEGDLDTNPDVQVVPLGSCDSMGGAIAPADEVGDWGQNYYTKK